MIESIAMIIIIFIPMDVYLSFCFKSCLTSILMGILYMKVINKIYEKLNISVEGEFLGEF